MERRIFTVRVRVSDEVFFSRVTAEFSDYDLSFFDAKSFTYDIIYTIYSDTIPVPYFLPSAARRIHNAIYAATITGNAMHTAGR